jgi:hypothetical protein
MASASSRTPARARRPVTLPRALLPAGVFVVAAVLSGLTVADGLQPNDEGLMLQAAARIADGQVPYSDFWWYYPPGHSYLLGGLWELFGPSLATWRVLRMLCDATVALLAFELARRRAPVGLALVAALGAALAMAYPTSPHPFPVSLALALGALLAFERSPVAAGLLLGVSAFWRLEFAAYLGAGIALAYLARPAGAPPPGRRWEPLVRMCLPAAALAAALYVPVVAAAGADQVWELVVRYPLLDFGDYQGLPFPLDYDGRLAAGSAAELRTTAEALLQFYLPLALLVGLAACLVALALDFARERDWPQVAAGVFSLGMAHYLFVRPDLFHTAPLAVMLCVLAAWVLGRPSAAGRRAWPRRVAAAACALALLFVVVEGADRRVLALGEDTVALDLPVADGVRERPGQARPLERAVRYAAARVPEGDPIYVTTSRSDLVTSGHPLFYVLAGRPNPTRYDIAAPGVVTSRPVQREIVGDLERERVALVVRFDDPITTAPEPNRAGESTGVRLLDAYLARRYRPVARFGGYEMLARR